MRAVKDIVQLPANPFSGADRARLERFGVNSVACNRATHWSWATDTNGRQVFDIYRGNDEQVLVTRISRDRGGAGFRVRDVLDGRIAEGALEPVLNRLARYLANKQGSEPDPAA